MLFKAGAQKIFSIILLFVAITSCKKDVVFQSGYTVQEVLPYINELRTRGVWSGGKYFPACEPLTWNDTLGQVALTHSNDMASHDFYSHTGTDSSSAGERIAAAGYNAKKHEEDLALGPALPIDVVGGLKNNYPSCKNFMDPDLTEIGAAVAAGPSSLGKDTIAHTNQSRGGDDFFYWTLVIAKPK